MRTLRYPVGVSLITIYGRSGSLLSEGTDPDDVDVDVFDPWAGVRVAEGVVEVSFGADADNASCMVAISLYPLVEIILRFRVKNPR